MNCEIIKDLLPLYIDNCCSDESATLVKNHLEACDDCKELYEKMTTQMQEAATFTAPVPKLNKINERRASVLQSLLLYASFALIVIGVALEAAVASGFTNSVFAFGVVVPSTGFMLSLSNWYFVRLYKSKKRFANFSLLANLAFTLCGFVFSCFHYELFGAFAEAIKEMQFSDILGMFFAGFGMLGSMAGIFMTVIFCLISKTASTKYAQLLGKE